MSKFKYSILICTFNRDRYIKYALQHVLNLEFTSSEYEVVVINNNSTDNTEKICREVMNKNRNININYIVETNQGLSYARNAGIKYANGDYIIFIDDDAFVRNDYLLNLDNFLINFPDFIAGGGKIIPVYERDKPKWMNSFLYPLIAAMDMGDSVKIFDKGKFPLGANMFYKKGVFNDIGYFKINLGRKGDILEGGEEKDFIARLKKTGTIVYYVPDVVVYHMIPDNRLTFDYIKKQAVGIGRSEKKRIMEQNYTEKVHKVISELFKITGTLFLVLYYLFILQPSKGLILVKFRFWVLKGYFY